jgi:hypothetical protein
MGEWVLMMNWELALTRSSILTKRLSKRMGKAPLPARQIYTRRSRPGGVSKARKNFPHAIAHAAKRRHKN